MFDVTIKTLDGRNSVFTVDDEIKVEDFKAEVEAKLIKVEDFKAEVEAKLEIPVAQQRLIFQGRALQDDSRLIDCGVQNKVVHLVPRPPPSAQREPRPEPASVTNSTGTNSTFGNVPWGGIDMQQAIQDITAGIFNGLGDFTRNVQLITSVLPQKMVNDGKLAVLSRGTLSSVPPDANRLIWFTRIPWRLFRGRFENLRFSWNFLSLAAVRFPGFSVSVNLPNAPTMEMSEFVQLTLFSKLLGARNEIIISCQTRLPAPLP
ncbi:hypothetical protein AHF37_10502 [Paragonimus kellicotti]|nr:hypothetical protein AHF37_10502 [Paragonimus kellicotti]